MSKGQTKKLQRAVEELKALVSTDYPTATFEVSDGEDPEGTYLLATVDVEDTDEVMDKVIDRLVTLQVDEELPLYFLALPTPERNLQRLQAAKAAGGVPTHVRKITDLLS